jgi:hypothetical protein
MGAAARWVGGPLQQAAGVDRPHHDGSGWAWRRSMEFLWRRAAIRSTPYGFTAFAGIRIELRLAEPSELPHRVSMVRLVGGGGPPSTGRPIPADLKPAQRVLVSMPRRRRSWIDIAAKAQTFNSQPSPASVPTIAGRANNVDRPLKRVTRTLLVASHRVVGSVAVTPRPVALRASRTITIATGVKSWKPEQWRKLHWWGGMAKAGAISSGLVVATGIRDSVEAELSRACHSAP